MHEQAKATESHILPFLADCWRRSPGTLLTPLAHRSEVEDDGPDPTFIGRLGKVRYSFKRDHHPSRPQLDLFIRENIFLVMFLIFGLTPLEPPVPFWGQNTRKIEGFVPETGLRL